MGWVSIEMSHVQEVKLREMTSTVMLVPHVKPRGCLSGCCAQRFVLLLLRGRRRELTGRDLYQRDRPITSLGQLDARAPGQF